MSGSPSSTTALSGKLGRLTIALGAEARPAIFCAETGRQ
jgi:hypothetical protein